MRTFAKKQKRLQKPIVSDLAQPRTAKPGLDHHEHPILHLQRSIGNQAVQRILQTPEGSVASNSIMQQIHITKGKGNRSGNIIQKKDDKADSTSTEDKTKADKIADEDLNTLAAIVATEANIGQEDDMEWVYINLYTKNKSSINESTPYRKKSDIYKFNRYLLDDTTYKDDALKSNYFKNECRKLKGSKQDKACDDLKTIADVYSANESYYAGSNKKRVKNIKDEIANKFKSPSSNPGFNSNGNLDDLNRKDGEWPKIRAYLRLQDADSTLPVLIKKMGAGRTFEVVYKKDQIMDFFKNHSDKLPKKVPQYP
jgi:hypothetical protein